MQLHVKQCCLVYTFPHDQLCVGVYYDVIWPVLVPWLSNKCLRRGNIEPANTIVSTRSSPLGTRLPWQWGMGIDGCIRGLGNIQHWLQSREERSVPFVRELCLFSHALARVAAGLITRWLIRELHIIGDAGEHVSVLFLVCSWRHDGYGWQEQKVCLDLVLGTQNSPCLS